MNPSNAEIFNGLFRRVEALTIVSRDRCEWLFQMSRHAAQLPGDIAELGVYRGGTSILLKLANPKKTVHAFDTFEGIPNAQPGVDVHRNGDFRDVSSHDIQAMKSAGVRCHSGLFPDTAIDVAAVPFCFAHFDGDTYGSAIAFIEFFWPRLVAGGVLMFDDYGWSGCPGVRRAVQEHRLQAIVTTKNQAMVIKTDSP